MQVERLIIPEAIVVAMVLHAREERPRECCGILAGHGRTVLSHFRLVNEAESQTEYFAAANLIGPFRTMRERSEELVAIYHSHPASPPIPSRKDLEQNYYPDTPHIIISLVKSQPEIRAYLLQSDNFAELAWGTSPAKA